MTATEFDTIITISRRQRFMRQEYLALEGKLRSRSGSPPSVLKLTNVEYQALSSLILGAFGDKIVMKDGHSPYDGPRMLLWDGSPVEIVD